MALTIDLTNLDPRDWSVDPSDWLDGGKRWVKDNATVTVDLPEPPEVPDRVTLEHGRVATGDRPVEVNRDLVVIGALVIGALFVLKL